MRHPAEPRRFKNGEPRGDPQPISGDALTVPQAVTDPKGKPTKEVSRETRVIAAWGHRSLTAILNDYQTTVSFNGNFRHSIVNKVDGQVATSKRSFFSSCRCDQQLYNDQPIHDPWTRDDLFVGLNYPNSIVAHIIIALLVHLTALSEWTFLSTRGAAMQIISRRENESIVIGNDIVVTVLEFADDFVRLAIESPNEEPSYREEVIHLESRYAELQSN